ncbi:MAG: glycosyltransferase family 4 protein [Verrucomicrobiota bacterium]
MRVAILTIDNREMFCEYAKPTPYFGSAVTYLLNGFALIPEAEVHVVSCTKRPMASPAKLAGNIWFHSVVVPQFGWLRTAYQGCVRATRKKLAELQPEIVHGQGTERDSAISAVFSRFPNVLTIHGNMRKIAAGNQASWLSYQWAAARLEAFVLPRTDGVVCISRYTESLVQALTPRTWLIPNAVDAALFGLPRRPEPVPVVLCVSTICPLKNQNSLIRALQPLAARRPFRLVFVGSHDPQDAYAREFLDLVKTNPWCEYAGAIPRESVWQFYQRASALVLSSLEDNCPMVVLEAQAAGIPLVAANVGGVPDLVADGQTGLLCNPHDGGSMLQAVERLLNDPALAARLAQQGLAEAHQRYHPKTVAQRHLEIYRELVERKRGVAPG